MEVMVGSLGKNPKMASGKWADNSDMLFNNFPPVRSSIPSLRRTIVINYAVIFKEDYQWGYVAPRPIPRMGYVCENMTC